MVADINVTIGNEVSVKVTKSNHVTCSRCWNLVPEINEDELCPPVLRLFRKECLKMRILVVNDDGIQSPYLETLVKVASRYGFVYVAAQLNLNQLLAMELLFLIEFILTKKLITYQVLKKRLRLMDSQLTVLESVSRFLMHNLI